MRIRICWVGKTQTAPIKSLLSTYLARLKHFAPIETVELPDLSRRRGLKGAALLAAEGAELARVIGRESRNVVLDERGKEFSSPEFASWFAAEQLRGTREIVFIIGGPEGVARALLEQAHLRLSLGRMTWPHELARVLLAEQIYRAWSILRNLPYHK